MPEVVANCAWGGPKRNVLYIAGTTSLYRYLTGHPDVGGATKKEVHFFDRSYDNGVDWYLAHFPERGVFAVVGESSPSDTTASR